MNNNIIQQRCRIVLAVFILLMLLVMGKVLFLGVFRRDAVLEWGKTRVWRRGILPAVRGSILASDGTVLVRSERCFSLYLSRSYFLRKKEYILLSENIRRVIPRADFSRGNGIVAEDLTPQEIAAISGFTMRYPELKVVSSLRRVAGENIDGQFSAEALAELGRSEVNSERSLRGISGIEAAFDRELRGRHGRYEVRLDRYGNWIGDSFRVLKKPERGNDVMLDKELSEKILRSVKKK